MKFEYGYSFESAVSGYFEYPYSKYLLSEVVWFDIQKNRGCDTVMILHHNTAAPYSLLLEFYPYIFFSVYGYAVDQNAPESGIKVGQGS